MTYEQYKISFESGYYLNVFGKANWNSTEIKSVIAELNCTRNVLVDEKHLENHMPFYLTTYLGGNSEPDCNVTIEYDKGSEKISDVFKIPEKCNMSLSDFPCVRHADLNCRLGNITLS
uniref:Group-specific protein n=1 Tax=Strongyloides papillosus TaxID=174720 RepID=A0A0N5BEU2_STREA